VRRLLESCVPRDNAAFHSIGYLQLFQVIDGEQTLEGAISTIEHDTHRYVRHQQTWLRRNPNIIWVDVMESGWLDQAAALVQRFIDQVPVDSHSDKVRRTRMPSEPRENA
jgi:tRNA A37 N6-isopentenylltransferase MiaA